MTARHSRLLEHAIDLFHRALILAYIRARKGERTAALRRVRAYVAADLGAPE